MGTSIFSAYEGRFPSEQKSAGGGPTCAARAGRLRAGLAYGLAAGALLGGCSSSPTGPGLRLQVAALAGNQSCQRGTTGVPFTPLLREGTLRLSVLRRDPEGTKLQCDLTAAVPSQKASVDLGPVDRARVDIFAEFFDQSGKRVLSGAALGASSVGADGTPQSLPLYPVGEWSCPAGVMSAGRAFHSATLLPTGEVLLLGGIEAVSGYGTDVFGVLASAEIFDPRKGTFSGFTSPGLTPRAFHQAAVLSATDSEVRILVYGGVTAPSAGLPVLLAPNSASPIRLSPAGSAAPAGAELLVYSPANRTLTSTTLTTSGNHTTAFAGGAGLVGGGLLAAGGSTFVASGAFNRNTPTPLGANGELALGPPAAMTASLTFAPPPPSPWLLAPSVTPLSPATALVLGAPVPALVTDPINMLALPVSGLPQGLTLASPMGVQLMGAPTIYHTATRLGPPLPAAGVSGDAQILVTGGFLMTAQPPQTPGQPPTPDLAVRLYTVPDPAGAQGPIGYQAIATYSPTSMCGLDDGHYRPAGFEAATATPSGQQVLVTGGTPTVRYGANQCVDCEPTDPATSKLLCVLSQVSLYSAATKTFSAGPRLGLGRMGHQQTALRDGTILVTGGLTRPGGDATAATAEAEVWNPRAADPAELDPEDPVVPVLDAGQKALRPGLGLASPCPVLN